MSGLSLDLYSLVRVQAPLVLLGYRTEVLRHLPVPGLLALRVLLYW
jgi:hypothetical protein